MCFVYALCSHQCVGSIQLENNRNKSIDRKFPDLPQVSHVFINRASLYVKDT